MHKTEHERITDLLRQSIVPVNTELDRDLWPQMLRRIRAREPQRSWLARLFSAPALSAVPWFDWALLAVLVVSVCVFPRSIPIWLYNF